MKKRYVIEFANDVIKPAKFPDNKKRAIRKVARMHEKGMTTAFEAVKEIIRIAEE